MSVPNLLLELNKLLSNAESSDVDIPVYCVMRISSTHHDVDRVIGVYFDKDKADKACEEFKATLQKRSQHKVYVQTSVLGK
jgi:hypothetical protein